MVGWLFFLAQSYVMHSYFCYGLNVRSELKIPEFLSAKETDADVEIRYGSRDEIELEYDADQSYGLRKTPDEITLWIDDVGGLRVRKGRELLISPTENAKGDGFRFLVAGVGMGFILYQRGVSSLHGSAVAIDGEAVAFVGWKGMGKSTTAGIFHSRGYPVITDDVLPLTLPSEVVWAIPSFPHLKLLPDTLEAALAEDPDAYLRVDSQSKKRSRGVTEEFPRQALPLRCIYVLDWTEDSSDLAASPITGQEACLELLRHSFALRMFQKDGSTTDQLEQISQFVAHVPVRSFARPHDLDLVDKIPSFVENDLAENTPACPREP